MGQKVACTLAATQSKVIFMPQTLWQKGGALVFRYDSVHIKHKEVKTMSRRLMILLTIGVLIGLLVAALILTQDNSSKEVEGDDWKLVFKSVTKTDLSIDDSAALYVFPVPTEKGQVQRELGKWEYPALIIPEFGAVVFEIELSKEDTGKVFIGYAQTQDRSFITDHRMPLFKVESVSDGMATIIVYDGLANWKPVE